MWKNRIARCIALILTCALLAAGLPGCGGAPAQAQPQPREQSSVNGSKSSANEPPRSESREKAAPEDESEEEPGESAALEQNSKEDTSSSSTSSSSIRDRINRIKRLQEQQRSESSSSESSKASSSSSSGSSKASSSSSKPHEELQVLPSVAGIARLAGLQAKVETSRSACFVDVDEGENPYDVTWDYGELYDAYIQQVDWDLLFDADYYIRTFPALAYLYHKDKALLLRHFQTVGIHEGRQGCESFNVAAYQKNCDAKVQKAFGDNYECYYLYYAMNYKTQKAVAASGGNEKKQLTMKLTNMQQTELDNINQYRAEVGVAPITCDPELSALACYRAYIDALEDWDAHDWIKAPENQDKIYEMMNTISCNSWGENTVHGYQKSKQAALKYCTSAAWYINYRYSKDHYKAMVDEQYHYLGSANAYVDVYEKENPNHPQAAAVYVQFDVFTNHLTTPLNS